MISIKDYARETGVTYEAVRQRIKRYEEDLSGHIHRQGRTQYLDDVAVAFLNDHRLQEPTVLYDRAAGEEFRELKAELKEAKELAADYWAQMKKKDDTIALMAQENRELRLQAASVPLLEADNEAARVKTQEAVEAAQRAQGALEKAQKKAVAEQAEKEAWKKYAAALEEYNAKNWFQRRKAEKPTPPSLQEDRT